MQKLTQEAIAYQRSKLFDELSDAVVGIRATPGLVRDENWHLQPTALRIGEIIKAHTNLNVALVTTNLAYPMVSFYVPKGGHVFSNVNQGNGESITRAFAKDGIASGGVNLETAKVSGIYERFTAVVIFPKNVMFGSNLTPGEVAATILHEVGHVFTSFEYASRIQTTNIFLSGIARSLDGSASTTETKDLYVFYADRIGASKEDIELLQNATSHEVATVLVMGQMNRFCESELGSSVFDENGMEALADQFTVRLGAGKELMTGLYKLERSVSFYDQRWNGAISSAATLLMLGAAVNPFLSIIVTLTLSMHVFNKEKDATYGSTKIRLERVLQQNSDRLKERSLSDSEKRGLLEDSKTIANVLKSYNDGSSILSFVTYCLKSNYRKNHDQEQFQRGLEKLGNSRLFDSAARLSLY